MPKSLSAIVPVSLRAATAPVAAKGGAATGQRFDKALNAATSVAKAATMLPPTRLPANTLAPSLPGATPRDDAAGLPEASSLSDVPEPLATPGQTPADTSASDVGAVADPATLLQIPPVLVLTTIVSHADLQSPAIPGRKAPGPGRDDVVRPGQAKPSVRPAPADAADTLADPATPAIPPPLPIALQIALANMPRPEPTPAASAVSAGPAALQPAQSTPLLDGSRTGPDVSQIPTGTPAGLATAPTDPAAAIQPRATAINASPAITPSQIAVGPMGVEPAATPPAFQPAWLAAAQALATSGSQSDAPRMAVTGAAMPQSRRLGATLPASDPTPMQATSTAAAPLAGREELVQTGLDAPAQDGVEPPGAVPSALAIDPARHGPAPGATDPPTAPSVSAPPLTHEAAAQALQPQVLQTQTLQNQHTPVIAAAEPTQARTAAVPMPPLAEQIAPPLILMAQGRGSGRRMSVSITPDELGPVSITVDRSATGTTTIQIGAERLATMQLLQDDRATLVQALDQAGIGQGDHSLSFSWDGSGGGMAGWNGPQDPPGERRHGPAASLYPADEPAPRHADATSRGGVDVTA